MNFWKLYEDPEVTREKAIKENFLRAISQVEAVAEELYTHGYNADTLILNTAYGAITVVDSRRQVYSTGAFTHLDDIKALLEQEDKQ